MSRRVRLGDWTCPSGNNVVAYYERDPVFAGVGLLAMEWDTPPPLRAEDEAYYVTVIQPAVSRLVTEYTERPAGRTLHIRP